jgi:hypothetical protein
MKIDREAVARALASDLFGVPPEQILDATALWFVCSLAPFFDELEAGRRYLDDEQIAEWDKYISAIQATDAHLASIVAPKEDR